MNYTVNQLAKISQSSYFGDGTLVVKNIVFDSRIIFSTADTAFIAINTTKNSGEKYIASAIEKGIKIIISEHRLDGFDDITWIIVENSVRFLQQLAKFHINQFKDLKTIGITGSNGKTIIKEWLFQCLNNEFSVVKSPKSFNSQIGLPISLLKTNEEHQLGIFEVGISKPFEMEILEQIFSPKIGILTHIGSAHLSNFKYENELIYEKIKLFKNSEIIIFNGDNELVYRKINTLYSSKSLISFGFKNHNDLKIISDYNDKFKEIEIQYLDEVFSFPVQKRDEATLSNALAVIAVLKYFGFENSKIIEKLNHLKSVEMRLESVNGVRNNLIINDSFNLDLDSLKIAFQFIKEYQKSEKVLVLTDFVESSNSKLLYEEVAKLTSEQNFKTLFLIGKEISEYQNKFKTKSYTFNNTKELINNHIFNNIENSLILLKGARKFEIESLKNLLELQKHDTVLEVNLNAILHNINVHKSLLRPETKMMAMVKAYSYGLGGYEIAEFLQHHHIDYLGVAYVDEGIDLRKNGISLPIMVMNPEQNSYKSIIEYNLEPEIYSFRVLDLFYEQLKQFDFEDDYPIHIKIETGMHRLGFKEDEMSHLNEKLKKMNIKVKSIFSHLSSADIEDERDYTLNQIQKFQRISNDFIIQLGYQPIRHILNSAGIINYTDYQFDMVRIGIGMLGISSSSKIENNLQNVVNFKTVISQISDIKKSESIGYSRKYKTEENTKIATIPVGYADGIPRLLSNGKGFVIVKNKKVPIVGNVCMDMMMIDIQNLKVKEGDEVVIFNSIPSLMKFAHYCNTIPYEVLTSISRRVKRIYIKN